MPNASEHEWLQYFEYIEDKSEDGKIFRDTLKRIRYIQNIEATRVPMHLA